MELETAINQVKVLTLDQIFHAGEYYTERSLSSVNILFSLFSKHYKALFLAPKWANRDRFVLCDSSCSAVYYSLLACFGYIEPQDLRDYTKHSGKTPLYPCLKTKGVDCDCGMPDMSFANAVGMAIAESVLRTKLKNCSARMVDHYTYCYADHQILGSKIMWESRKLAGELGLNKLIVLYNAYDMPTQNIVDDFEKDGWGVIGNVDGNDMHKIDTAIARAKESTRPTIIIFNTKEDLSLELSHCHNKHMDKYAIVRLKKRWNLVESMFQISPSAQAIFDNIKTIRGEEFVADRLSMEQNGYPLPELNNQYDMESQGEVIYDFCVSNIRENNSTFDVARRFISAYQHNYPKSIFIIGNDDGLVERANARFQPIDRNNMGAQYLDLHGKDATAAAIACGIALHRGLPVFYCGKLLNVELILPSMRRACIMNLPIKYMLVENNRSIHDSIRLCQPAEQIDYMRALSNIMVCRPCDSVELGIWFERVNRVAMPSAIIVSTEQSKVINRDMSIINNGAHIIQEEFWNADGVFYTSGTEVDLCNKARKRLIKYGYNFIVVSVSCLEAFEKCKPNYKQKIYATNVPVRIVVERSGGTSLSRFLLDDGEMISSKSFTTGEQMYDNVDELFTIENIVNTALKTLDKKGLLKQPITELQQEQNEDNHD
ncbi:MAG: transketolase-like TK C-terminal-containing protein [Clostridia bacterium]